MANSKYYGITKKQLLTASAIGEEIKRRDIYTKLPFQISTGPFNSVMVRPTAGDSSRDEINLGKVIEDLSRALEEVELAFYCATGLDYSQSNAILATCRPNRSPSEIEMFQDIYYTRVKEIWE